MEDSGSSEPTPAKKGFLSKLKGQFDVSVPAIPNDLKGKDIRLVKDHYELTAAGKKIEENKLKAAEGLVGLRSEKSEDWWNEFQFQKWQKGEYVPTKADLALNYRNNIANLTRDELKKVEKWLKNDPKFKEIYDKLPPKPTREVNVEEMAGEEVKLPNSGFASENRKAVLAEVKQNLQSGQDTFIELPDNYIADLTKEAISGKVELGGFGIEVFRVVPSVVDKDKKFEFNAKVYRIRNIFGRKFNGLGRGMNGSFSLRPAEGGNRLESEEIKSNPAEVFGTPLFGILNYYFGSEGLERQFNKYFKAQIGDSVGKIDYSIIHDEETDKDLMRVQFHKKEVPAS